MVECLLSVPEASGGIPRGRGQSRGIWSAQGIELPYWTCFSREDKGVKTIKGY